MPRPEPKVIYRKEFREGFKLIVTQEPLWVDYSYGEGVLIRFLNPTQQLGGCKLELEEARKLGEALLKVGKEEVET